jgi:hypothetical protein
MQLGVLKRHPFAFADCVEMWKAFSEAFQAVREYSLYTIIKIG